MLFPERVLLYVLLLALFADLISGRRRHHSYHHKSNRHEYPASHGLSGHRASGGYSTFEGNRNPDSARSHGFASYRTKYRKKYPIIYQPPQTLSYSPVHGSAPVQYPVYHGLPPNYVYKYKNSGSKYGTLLTGLSLLNLGALGVDAYSHIKQGNRRILEPGEVCKFEVKKDNGDYEETKIDCQIISSFILQDQARLNTSKIIPKPVIDILYEVQPNGTLLTINTTRVPAPTEVPESLFNVTQNEIRSVLMTPSSALTLVNALDVKGKDMEVTPELQCFVSRTSRSHSMRKNVPCGLLQAYADKSLQLLTSAAQKRSVLEIHALFIAFVVACELILKPRL